MNIGGNKYQLHGGQLLTRTTDSTQAGHILGDSNGRSAIPTGERQLSPAAVVLLRAFMHTIFIWSACTKHQEDPGPLMNLITKGVTDPRII
ncbi:hypothetical protein, partial [Salmonella sp. s54836]|uniref:hypothetical protein n=1 Tax=Salmonella sp. s54836 TaxID=3159673 RepID=UPI0039808A5A